MTTLRRHPAARWRLALASFMACAGLTAVPPITPPQLTNRLAESFASAFTLPQQPKPVILEFDYPTNELSTNFTFYVLGTNTLTLPLSNWPVVATIYATNWFSNSFWIAPISGTNYTLSCTQMISPQAFFWTIQTSNDFWGLAPDFSNIAGVPAAPRNDVNLRPKRGW